MTEFELWIRGCQINGSEVIRIAGKGRTALYKVTRQTIVKGREYVAVPAVYIGWVRGIQVCASTDFRDAFKAWLNRSRIDTVF